MADIVGMWNAFNAGELSPLMDGRTDQEKYFAGAKTLLNFVPTVQGPAVRRGGTRYLGPTKNSGRAWFTPFEFSAAQSYVLEFTDGTLRFWVNRGLLLSGDVPFELATPYSTALLSTSEGTSALRTAQSADVMWIVHATGAVPPYKLQRLGATNWTLTPVPFDRGPWNDINVNETRTVTASAATGTVTLTASSNVFENYHVGTSFFLESQNPDSVAPWRAGASFSAGNEARFEGNVYESVAGGTTGSSPPVHLRGRGSDGNKLWDYLHSGYGYATITAVTSPTTATATVVGRIPAQCVGGNTTTRWAFGAFNSNAGWPTNVTFFRERLVFSSARTVYLSGVGDFDNFVPFDGPDVTKETALKLTVASDRVDAIRWMAATRDLLLGTPRSELVMSEQTPQQVFAADNVTVREQTEYGARLLFPARVGDAVLFTQRSGRRLREMKYSYEIDRYKADDVSVLSPHVLDAGIVDMDFALEPDSLLWCVLGNGKLAALTYNRERGVIGWARHEIGGDAVVETVASIANPNERTDDVWFVCRRTINGQTVRYVEVLEDYRLAVADLTDAFYVDSGVTYDGTPTTTITGLQHLEGQVVSVFADGSAHADRTVVDGQIELTRPASKVHVGFKFVSRIGTMRPDLGGQNGTGQNRRRSTSTVTLRVMDTIGGKVGPRFDKLLDIKWRDPALAVGTVAQLFTGDKETYTTAHYDDDGYVCFEQDQPLPTTVVAIIMRQVVGG